MSIVSAFSFRLACMTFQPFSAALRHRQTYICLHGCQTESLGGLPVSRYSPAQ